MTVRLRFALLLLLAVALLGTSRANAQANFTFNGAGTPVASSATVIQQQLIRGTGLTWAVGNSGAVAQATAAANAQLYSQGGQQVRLAGSALTRVAANDMSASLVRGLRGGLVGLATTVAVNAALDLAKTHWDALLQSMVYNPDPTTTPSGPGGPTRIWQTQGAAPYPAGQYYRDKQSACDAQGREEFGAALASADASPTAINGCINNVFNYNTFGQPPTDPIYREKLRTQIVNLTPSTGVPTCPNGVTYNGNCNQPVTDEVGAGNITPQITGNNGPAIGQAITNAGGDVNGSSLPSVQLNPSSGPTTTTQNQDGTSTQTHQDYLPNCSQNRCAVSQQTTTVQLNPQGVPIGTPTVTTTSPGPQSGATPDPEPGCGLPTSPPCKIDETGTPSAAQGTAALAGAVASVATSQTGAIAVQTTAAEANGKNTAWSFSFAFPTGCTPYPMFRGVVVDMCAYQTMIHDLMTLVWWLACFFAVFSMWNRALLGGPA